MTTKKPTTKKIVTKPADVELAIEPVIQQAAPECPEKEVEISAKKNKHGKTKVIRDSFSFPEVDYLKILELKKLCLAEGVHVKKGELLRAGLQLLSELDLAELKKAVQRVEKVKTGRPKS
ncbi:MAG: hypothetical protein NTV00_10585 [Methylococcales bacterium]|nr:hypothetical protein [Methylococcales bacterium]